MPSDKMLTDEDEAVLADLAVKTFSIALTTADMDDMDDMDDRPAPLLMLSQHFIDDDNEDELSNMTLDDGRCDFTTSSDTYATVAFNPDRTAITIVGKKVGSFDVMVTCTDTKMETVEDMVTVTIVN